VTGLEVLLVILVIIIIALIAFFFYYFFRGAAGPVSIARPMESRVDMYLDRRFDLLMEEYSLITKPKLRKYRAEKEPSLLEEEGKIEALKQFQEDMTATLAEMEKRLDVLEAEFTAD
jgi:hypothetical protein